MATDERKRKFDGGPYHVAKNGDNLAWAYNESAKSVWLYVENRGNGTPTVNKILVRKETLRRLAALR